MRFKIFLMVLALVALPSAALAGAGVWTSPRGGTVSSLKIGESAEITPSGTGGTPVIELSCGSIHLQRPTDVALTTFDIQTCSANGGTCSTYNLTSPITSSSVGVTDDTPPKFFRINVAATPGATFTLTCNP